MMVVEAAASLTLVYATIGRAVAAPADLAADSHMKEKIEVF